ncbi:RICIN domain-containing protein [Siphonobacter sp. SORGH_AS_0500]|uniref:RICIN domain-containing protein n=1 Tax=Siphonobacter sp. SORGH_AS_0500 TaxID=1864824 RepID=UPI000CC160FB|nr:RICIN domain-containing protein [Siphonobacter sp. SORGH_AS_0500]MDR6196911.1 hypothetical protein [Siphonobacter sp. SORGH_AS_0500]PKK36173.1 hypothetical protein BWI96_12220 [Siphonobacter sp. SORGH_AS_0500]
MKTRLSISHWATACSFALLTLVTGCQKETIEEKVSPQSGSVKSRGARALPSSEPLQSVGNGTFYLVSRKSGKMIDVEGFQTSNGANIIQYGGTGGTNQRWTLQSLAGGYYSIIGVQSNKALQISQASVDDGGDVTIGDYTGANHQQWQFIPTNNGYYRIVNRNSGKDLDVFNQSIDDLAEIKQWGYWGGENQEWGLVTIQANGQLGWTLTTSDVPTDVRERITAAMNDACARYNAGAAWPARTLTVEYNPGVNTADGNTNGNIRFGSNASYQNTRTAMHEIAHTWGVGISGGWYANTSTGPFTGANAVALIKTYDGPDAVINTGGSHFWPYGLNYDNEWSEIAAFRHVKMVNAMRADGM